MTTKTVEEVLFVKTQAIPDIFYGLKKQTAEQYVGEMYEHPEFASAVIKPTQRITLVDVKKFVEYLRYKEVNRFK